LRSASDYEERGEASFQHWIRSAAEHKLANRARHWRAARRGDGEESLDADGACPTRSRRRRGPAPGGLLREEAERLRGAFQSLPGNTGA